MIVTDLASSGVGVAGNTVVRTLHHGGLQGQRAVHQSQTEDMDVAYVWRRKGEAFNPNNSVLTVTRWVESIVLGVCFAASDMGSLVSVRGIMKKDNYDDTLREGFEPPTCSSSGFKFQQIVSKATGPRHPFT